LFGLALIKEGVSEATANKKPWLAGGDAILRLGGQQPKTRGRIAWKQPTWIAVATLT
jgi:hypothetical protein